MKKLSDLLGSDEQERKKRNKELKTVLKKLKAKEKELREKCKSITDAEEREQTEKEIDILHAQRKKGISLLKAEEK